MEKYKLVRDMHENAGISINDLAEKWNVENRTIYRWIQKAGKELSTREKKSKNKGGRPRKYPDSLFDRIIELKTDIPGRSARMIRKILKKEFHNGCPSISLIDKFIRKKGLNRGKKNPNLLMSLGIEPIYSKPYYPQSKGKIERWFKTVQDDFLCEFHGSLEVLPNRILSDVNAELSKWVKW